MRNTKAEGHAPPHSTLFLRWFGPLGDWELHQQQKADGILSSTVSTNPLERYNSRILRARSR